MRVDQKEIELILSLYPIAKIRHIEIQETLAKRQSMELKKEIIKKDNFYLEIIQTVDEWSNNLSQDELILIDYRYFRGYNYQTIADRTNYSSHSSVLKILKKLIKKIEKTYINTMLIK